MIGTTISHYRILSHIGAGGMGTRVSGRRHQAAAARRAEVPARPDTRASRDASARLVREARAASALDHPHIGTMYEIGEEDGQPFIAMAYYEGETLAARLARGPLPIAEVAASVAQAGRRPRRGARGRASSIATSNPPT